MYVNKNNNSSTHLRESWDNNYNLITLASTDNNGSFPVCDHHVGYEFLVLISTIFNFFTYVYTTLHNYGLNTVYELSRTKFKPVHSK